MILIGMFDSAFVRRVAISMNLYGMAFEHRNWSVGPDFGSGNTTPWAVYRPWCSPTARR